jgi:hypothetical protein
MNNEDSSLGKNSFGIRNFIKGLEDSLHEEQKELFFHRKSREDENDYFNFIKFLFNNPSKV